MPSNLCVTCMTEALLLEKLQEYSVLAADSLSRTYFSIPAVPILRDTHVYKKHSTSLTSLLLSSNVFYAGLVSESLSSPIY